MTQTETRSQQELAAAAGLSWAGFNPSFPRSCHRDASWWGRASPGCREQGWSSPGCAGDSCVLPPCSILPLAAGIPAWPGAPRCCPLPVEGFLPRAEEKGPLQIQRRSSCDSTIRPWSQGRVRRTLQGKALLGVGKASAPSRCHPPGWGRDKGCRSGGCWRHQTPTSPWGVAPRASPQGLAIDQETLEKHAWMKHKQPSFHIETKNVP